MGFGHPLHIAFKTIFRIDGVGGILTHDLRFRKPSLYPTELQPHWKNSSLQGIMESESRRGDRNRDLWYFHNKISIEESPGSHMVELAG